MVKDVIGQEKMIKYHDYFKAKYTSLSKIKKSKSKDKKVRLTVTSFYVSGVEDSNP